MRILVVDLGREYRGGQHQALLLLQGLLARGHASELIAVLDTPLALRAKQAGISVHSLYPGRRRFDAALQIRGLVNEQLVDVVHANEPHALTSAWLARAHRRVPIVASRRIALPLARNCFSLARYRTAARIVAVSHFVEKSVTNSGLPAESVKVIYDGVEIPPEISRADRNLARGHLGIPQECLCIGNVAAFVPEKGHAILLRAFANLTTQFPGCILLLHGEGPERKTLRELARQLQILEGVKFAGPEAEIQEIFAAIDVFAFPSHEEPLGSALLAAMAHGLPVVAIGRGGISEVVESGKNGLLVNALDPDPMAIAIGSLLADPVEAHRLGEAARETVRSRFSADHMVDETLQLYKEVIGDE